MSTTFERAPDARAFTCLEGDECADGPGFPVLIRYQYPSTPPETFAPQRKGRLRVHVAKSGLATMTVWSDDETKPEKLLEFEVAYRIEPKGGFSFNGAIHTGSRVKLRALGDRDVSGYVNMAHLHEVALVNLPSMGKWDAQFRVSGRVQLMMPPLADQNQVFHLEPANAKLDFHLPLTNRAVLGVGAEAGTWFTTGLQGEFAPTPGARATLSLRF